MPAERGTDYVIHAHLEHVRALAGWRVSDGPTSGVGIQVLANLVPAALFYVLHEVTGAEVARAERRFRRRIGQRPEHRHGERPVPVTWWKPHAASYDDGFHETRAANHRLDGISALGLGWDTRQDECHRRN